MLIHESKFAMLEHPASRRRPVHYTLVPKVMFKKKWFWRVWKHRKRLDIAVGRAMFECGFTRERKSRDE